MPVVCSSSFSLDRIHRDPTAPMRSICLNIVFLSSQPLQRLVELIKLSISLTSDEVTPGQTSYLWATASFRFRPTVLIQLVRVGLL